MKNNIGFHTSWMTNEEEILPPTQLTASPQTQSGLTPAHLELKGRIKMTEIVIQGKGFIKLSTNKRKEFMNEYKWLVSLDAELGA